MKKDTGIVIAIILLGIVLYGLTLRGAPGNPTADQFKGGLDQAANAFELSPERGRYVHVVALAEHGSFELTRAWADVVYPDVGVSPDGRYYSFFAPGVAYAALPFYLFGARYGLGQVATFAIEPLVSIITLVFIYLIGRRIFVLPRFASFFAALTYGFASTSWSYAITLYQNAFTACLIVTAFYAAWRFARGDSRYAFLYAAYVWLAYALAIFVDYPNAVLMAPVMVYLAISTFNVRRVTEGIAVGVRWSAIAAFTVFVFVTGLHLSHNAAYYGGWSHLAGELKGYTPDNIATSTLITAAASSTPPSVTASSTVPAHNKTALGFFHEQAMPNGFFVLLFGDERGLFFFSPLFLFSILGIAYALRKRSEERAAYVVPIALVAVNIFLYASWGDPWGGWAYGPRYLIPAMPWLALFVGVALSGGRFRLLKKALAYALFLVSSAVALTGALTSNAVPPKSEAMLLPVKAYNFLHGIQFLRDGRSGSFIYTTYLSGHVPLADYFISIFLLVAIVAALALLLSYQRRHA